jgi:hypothetical protein
MPAATFNSSAVYERLNSKADYGRRIIARPAQMMLVDVPEQEKQQAEERQHGEKRGHAAKHHYH